MRHTLLAALCMLAPALALAAPSGTFRHAHNVGFGAQSSLDPASKGRVLQIIEKIQSRLVRPGPGGKPAPDLATAWEPNADGTVWTFHIREGVRFHDGSTLDAHDVVYSIKRVIDPDYGSPARAAVRMIESIEATGPFTVRMTLASTFADLPLQLMDPRLRIIPEGSGDTIDQTGIGTGPFRVQKFDPDGITVLIANEDYWEGPPGLARIEVIGVPDAQARLQAFLSGQLDMERGIVPLLRRALDKSLRYQLLEIPTGNWMGLAFRTDVPPYDDPRVRRALRLVVDRDEMLQLALDGGGVVSCDTPVAPNDQYRAEMDCPPDPDRARELLAEAGYPDGIDIDLHVSVLDQSWPVIGVAFQEQAARAGIRVNLINAAADGYWSNVWMKKDAFTTSWGDRPADQALNEAFHSTAKWNETYYANSDFDRLLEAARAELDFNKRRALYIEAQKYLAKNSGTLIPFHVTQLVVLSNRVTHFDPVPNDALRWHLVTVVD
ncbi:peptide/nickel transport system substrate-binding protein [Roseovarius azorensis]|uniref:Peptide/nickel transport system substrate-binding protein n=1 Tax=Roseovarius azorensis TaxID=1287727 RepID=A0A1H7GVZ7_9RHOB|nr:ABC transporter substrate-binding protein [Roseovarius azorensis]SEK42326.1 peptide/nickel transport system substrate-binding protein [Roseovarius azorensis]